MKSFIALSAITLLAALALTGCSQDTSKAPTDNSGTNSSMTTNSLPDASTNMPASTNN